MKITNLTKIIMIVVAMMLVLSLFACDNNKNDETNAPDNVTTEGKGGDTTEPDGGDTTEPDGGDTTESGSDETDPTCQHQEETVAGTPATCTEAGLTDGKKCSLCGEILVAQEEIAALGHTEETVAGTPATCTEAGLTDGKKCSVCGEVLTEQEEIAALGHNPEAVEAKAATCVAGGNAAYSTCACGVIFDAEGNVIEAIPTTEIDPENHSKINEYAPMYPTTAEPGITAAYSECEGCKKLWDADGNAITEAPTAPAIVPESEVYLGAAELAGMTVAGTPGSLFAVPEMSADRSYVRFARAGESNDGNIMLINTADGGATGNYMVIKYRTDSQKSVQIWANTTEHGHSGGKSNFYKNFSNDNEWHIMIIDLAKENSTYVKADAEGKYTIQWSRIDLLDGKATEGYIDIAYIVFTSDLKKIGYALQEGDTEICSHFTDPSATLTNNGDNHSMNCVVCGAAITENHYAAGEAAWNAGEGAYVGVCPCGANIKTYFRYETEAHVDAAAIRMDVNAKTDADGTTFVRYQHTGEKLADGSAYADSYAIAFRGGKVGSGKYMIIRYRAAAAADSLELGPCFGASVATGRLVAQDGNQSMGTIGNIVADNEWHYLIVDITAKGTKDIVADENGNIDLNFLRISFTNGALEEGSSEFNYLDIDFIAFATELEALENYAANN